MSWSARNTSPVDLDTTILLREEEDRTGLELGWDAVPPIRQRKMINCRSRKAIRFTRECFGDETVGTARESGSADMSEIYGCVIIKFPGGTLNITTSRVGMHVYRVNNSSKPCKSRIQRFLTQYTVLLHTQLSKLVQDSGSKVCNLLMQTRVAVLWLQTQYLSIPCSSRCVLSLVVQCAILGRGDPLCHDGLTPCLSIYWMPQIDIFPCSSYIYSAAYPHNLAQCTCCATAIIAGVLIQ